MLILSLGVSAQIPVVDGLSNKQLVSKLLKWVQDYMKQNQQDGRLKKILSENISTQEKITKLLSIKEQIEKGLYLAKDFRKLRLSDLTKIRQEIYGIPASERFVTEVPYVSQFSNYINQPSSVSTAKQAYNYLFASTAPYNTQSSSIRINVNNVKEEKAKLYAIHIAAQKKKIALAMTYTKLADQYTQLSEDLSAQVTADNTQKMTTGERIQAQKLANDYMIKSMEMKQKSDQLLKEASQKSDLVKEVDASYQNAITRYQLSRVQVD